MFFPEGFLWLRIAQRNDLNRGLSRLENELHENRKAIKRLRREKVVPRNRQCPFCGGELAGEFSRCNNCGGEVAWVNTSSGRLPCKPGQEGLLIEQIEQVVREQNLKQEQQEAKVWTKCPACDKKHQVSPNERHSRCSACKDKVSGGDVLALIVGCLVLLAIVASPFAFWFYWDPRGAAATTKWLWGGTRFLLFWGGLIVVSFFGLMASIAFISGRKTGGEPLIGGSPLDPPRESVAPLTPDQLRPAALQRD